MRCGHAELTAPWLGWAKGQRMNGDALATTQTCEDRDFAEWHQGCPWCAVWVVGLDIRQVRHHVAALRAAALPWLLPRYERQPHITLGYRGLMAGPQGHRAAQFGVEHWAQDIATLQALAVQPLTVRLGGADSFATVPYLAVQDHPVLHQLHQALTGYVQDPDWQYVPHVTLGHYACSVPAAPVVQRLQAVAASLQQLEVVVDRIELVRYQSHDIAGALTVEGYWDMRLQQYVPQAQALWPL